MRETASSGTKGRMGSGQASRLALITGASSGIGAAFAAAYARRGFDVALVARRADRLNVLAERLSAAHGVAAFAIPADLATFDAPEVVLKAVAERGRVVDVLVNNAGFGIPNRFVDVPWTHQRDFLTTMALSPCGLAYGVIPGMIARGHGAILNIASVAGFSPGVAGNTLYPAVKSLMIKFSQSLDAEYRGRGLKVTAVCPGFTRTEFAAVAGIEAAAGRESRLFWQTPEAVVEVAISGNQRGRVVVIPGWHNRLSVFLLRALPEPLVRAVVGAAAAKYIPEGHDHG
jgi:uncharacterized protein